MDEVGPFGCSLRPPAAGGQQLVSRRREQLRSGCHRTSTISASAGTYLPHLLLDLCHIRTNVSCDTKLARRQREARTH
jgi:hypothetical protein